MARKKSDKNNNRRDPMLHALDEQKIDPNDMRSQDRLLFRQDLDSALAADGEDDW